MSELSELAEKIQELFRIGDPEELGEMADRTGLDDDDLDTTIEALIDGELQNLVGGDDEEVNEQLLRRAIYRIAAQAFYVGIGWATTHSDQGVDVAIPIEPEALEALGLAIIRNGHLSVRLFAAE